MEILFVVLFAYMRRIRDEKLRKAAEAAASKAKEVLPVEIAKQAMPALMK